MTPPYANIDPLTPAQEQLIRESIDRAHKGGWWRRFKRFLLTNS